MMQVTEIQKIIDNSALSLIQNSQSESHEYEEDLTNLGEKKNGDLHLFNENIILYDFAEKNIMRCLCWFVIFFASCFSFPFFWEK